MPSVSSFPPILVNKIFSIYYAKNMNKNPGNLDFMNWLLGAGASDSGQYVGSGYWDRQEELAKKRGPKQEAP